MDNPYETSAQKFARLDAEIKRVRRERDEWQTRAYEREASAHARARCHRPDDDDPSFFLAASLVIAVLALIFLAVAGLVALFNQGEIKGNIRAEMTKTAEETAKRTNLSLIRPITGQESCQPGSHWIGYVNGTTRAVGKLHFVVRGYLPNRVDNIVKLDRRDFGDGKGNMPWPNVKIDRIVQAQETYGECVKLNLVEGLDPEDQRLKQATYKVEPARIEFLDDFTDYNRDVVKPAVPYSATCSEPVDGRYSCKIDRNPATN
jgi:hypothetical protein